MTRYQHVLLVVLVSVHLGQVCCKPAGRSKMAVRQGKSARPKPRKEPTNVAKDPLPTGSINYKINPLIGADLKRRFPGYFGWIGKSAMTNNK